MDKARETILRTDLQPNPLEEIINRTRQQTLDFLQVWIESGRLTMNMTLEEVLQKLKQK